MVGDLVWRKYLLGHREGSHVRFELDENGGMGNKYSMFVAILLVTNSEDTNALQRFSETSFKLPKIARSTN